MKQTALCREKHGDYAACLKYSVRIFVEWQRKTKEHMAKNGARGGQRS